MADDSLTLLLVEDDPGTSTSLSRILELRGYRVDTAVTIAATLDRDNWSDYLAIILDRKLPDGMIDDILPQLKQLAPDAALIVVTAYTDLDGTVAALRHAVVDYFFKPINPEILLASLTNIVERRRMTEALRESQERIRAILNTAADAIITINEHGIIDGVNPATEQMLGYTEDELVGQNVTILMPPPYCDEHDGYIARYLETGEARIIGIGREVVAARKDGSVFPVDLAVSKVDQLKRFTGILRDVSGRKRLEREIVEIALLEQQRLGADLHDECGQELTALGLLTNSLIHSLKEHAPADVEVATRIGDGLKNVLQYLRDVARGLSTTEVDPAELPAALEDLTARLDETSRLSCVFHGEESVRIEDSLIATHLYHIAQEACTNALKHADAEKIQVRLWANRGVVTLQIQDDGVGIPDDAREGLGLRIMRNRASVIGADLTIEPGKLRGTSVICTLPKERRHGPR